MKIRYMLLHAFGTGGTIRTVFNQANFLAAAGHEVELISAVRSKDEPAFDLDPRVRVHFLVDRRAGAAPRGARGWQRAWLSRRRPRVIPRGEFGFRYFDRYVERELVRFLRGLPSDGVLVTTRPALNVLAARYAPRRLVRVAQEHMNLATHRSDVQQAIVRDYPRLDAVTVLTRRDQEDYRRLLPDMRIERIPNAVHSVDQQPSTHSAKIALAAGRLSPQKGFDLLIPAFAQVVERHPDWQLRIFGSGSQKARLRSLIEEHHLYNHVFLMGQTSEMDRELAKASLYVLSSRFEGLPMVLVEAMSHALPVVSYDCPTGPADVLTHGKEGFLVPPGDVDALAEAMTKLMEDEYLRAEMGDAALQTARSYAPDAVLPRWEELFRELQQARQAR